MKRLNIAVILLVLAKLGESSAPFELAESFQSVQPLADGEYRLPDNTKPISYKVHLKTDVHILDEAIRETFRFTGHVEIKIAPQIDTDFIRIHSRKINITGTPSLTTEAGTPVELADGAPEIDEKHDFLTFKLRDPNTPLLPSVVYVLSLDYEGWLRDDNQGFYYSFYINNEGKSVPLATTQFESTDARHGIPCYDEPSIRATFQITIDCGLPYHAISNMAINEAESRIE